LTSAIAASDFAEVDVLERPSLHSKRAQPDAELGGGVADRVVDRFAGIGDDQLVAGLEIIIGRPAHGNAPRLHPGDERLLVAVDPDQQVALRRAHPGQWLVDDELALVDDHDVVADPLDVLEDVRRDDDRDPEHPVDALDQLEHVVPALRVHAIGRLVEEDQRRVVDQRLGQFDSLLHAGREALDQPVALFAQPNLVEDVGGALASGLGRESAHLAHVGDEIGGGGPGRQAVGFGHVPDPLANLDPIRAGVEAEHRRLARGRVGQAEQRPDERGLAGPVGAEQPDTGAGDVECEVGECGVPAVARGQAGHRDDRPLFLAGHGHQRRVQLPRPRWSILGLCHA
jgi:hypothetical protein